jgi:transcriptional regulator with XRE-family HTH domain
MPVRGKHRSSFSIFNFSRMTREKIKSLRKTQKLTQAELGARCHLTASEISRIECGYRTLTAEEEKTIAAVLGVEAEAPPPVIAPAAPAKGLTAAKAPPPPPASAVLVSETAVPPPAAAAKPAAPKPEPTGSDLSDPANFGVMPDLQLLELGKNDRAAFRARLMTEVTRANTILHTPRVPAAVWRAWRQFEQQASERLRDASGVADVAPLPAPKVVPPPVAVIPVQKAETAAAAEADKGESKSLNSLFVEVARGLLPADQVERLNRAAEAARQQDQSIGFMKHFRRIASDELNEAELKQVNDEANRRLASPDRWRVRRGRKHSSSAAK